MAANETTNIPPEPAKNKGPAAAVENSQNPDESYAFKDPPLKPDGDPWEILFKPAIEADTVRCNAWKEEVQTLLIFAGLFSAVVTAFVIESYRFLQPDPNAAIVGLLFHIANGLNNSSPFPPSVDPAAITAPFSQTSSSVRINILWFLSLILSLTTVLIGTIALQWLREHQTYPESSTKEKVAILHMRTEALDVWCVPHIFAALPVLLQAALALFLAGLVDFVLPLERRLIISIGFIVGLTLLFLVATTALPICQGFFFLTGLYPYRTPPAACAFKSPQSRVIWIILSFPLRLLSYGLSYAYLDIEDYDYNVSLLRRYSLLVYLRKVLQQKTWATSDRKWLDLRDGYHQCILDKDHYIYEHQEIWQDEFQLHDLSQVLVNTSQETPSAKHTQEFLGAVVYCFREISKSVWTNQGMAKHYIQCKDRRSNYFEQLLGQSSCSLSKWLIHGGVYQFNQLNEKQIYDYIGDKKTVLFYHDQMFYFLQLLLRTHTSSELAQYCTRLWTHIMGKLNIQPLQPIDTSASIPNVLHFNVHEFIQLIDSDATRYSAAANMLKGIFKAVASYQISQDQPLHALYIQPTIPDILDSLAFLSHYLRFKQRTNTPNNPETQQFAEIEKEYTSMFKFVAEHLNKERADATSNPEDTPSVLFYLAAVFTWRLLDLPAAREVLSDQDSGFGQGLRSLLEDLLLYRSWLGERKNNRLETRFAGKDRAFRRYEKVDRFSEEWWDYLSQWLEEANKENERHAHAVQMISISEATGTQTNGPGTAHAASASLAVNVITNVEVSDVNSPDGERRTTTNAMHSESQAEPSTLPVPIPPNCKEVHVQQTDLDLPMTTNLIPSPNAHPDSIDTPSEPLPHLTSVDPEEIRAVANEGLEGAPADSVVPSILADLAQPPVSISSSIDNGLAPDKTAEPGEPHVAIEVHQPRNPEDIEVGRSADASTSSAALDPEVGDQVHVMIEIGVVSSTEALELAESAGGGAGPPLCDLDQADEGGRVTFAKDADASIELGRA